MEVRVSRFEVRVLRFEVRGSRLEVRKCKSTLESYVFECCELRFLHVDSAFERTCHIQTALSSPTHEVVKADSTLRTSRAVPHPSTDRALRRLTSEVRRDPVHSTRYGRQRSLKSFSSRFLFGNSNLTRLFSKTCKKHGTPHTQFMIPHVFFHFLQGHLDRARQNERESGNKRPRTG